MCRSFPRRALHRSPETAGSTEPWGNSPHERPDNKKKSMLPENLSHPLLRVSSKGHHQYMEARESAVKSGRRGTDWVECFIHSERKIRDAIPVFTAQSVSPRKPGAKDSGRTSEYSTFC